MNIIFILATLQPKFAMALDPLIQSSDVAATFKIIILGQSTVGKTSLMSKFTTGKFQHSLMATVGESASCYYDNSNTILD